MRQSASLLRSVLVIGSANFVSILFSILRMKLLAVMLGPSGVGLYSIYLNLQQMGTIAAGLGFASSGVREIALTSDDSAALSRVWRVLLGAHVAQGLLAMAAIWVFREPLAHWLLGERALSWEVGLVGVAVLLSLVSASQLALLQGMRRIGELGRVTVAGAACGTTIGGFTVWIAGEAGLILFLLMQPLAAIVVAWHYTARLPRPAARPKLDLRQAWAVVKPLAKLGVMIMLGGLVVTATLLVVRSILAREFGLDAAGEFAAAWSITMTYVGFLLTAMSADYYPRLAALIGDRTAANQLMNSQAQLGLAIGGPILLIMIGAAPWVVWLLYSDGFSETVTLLQWQTLGNIFKLACWPLGFSFLAAGKGKVFLMTQSLFCAVYVLLLYVGLPIFGLVTAGVAFLAGYICQFVIMHLLTTRLQGFRWESLSLRLLAMHSGLGALLLGLALFNPFAAALAAPPLAMAAAVWGLHATIGLGDLYRRVAPTLSALRPRGCG